MARKNKIRESSVAKDRARLKEAGRKLLAAKMAEKRDSEGHGWNNDNQRKAAVARSREEGEWQSKDYGD